MKQEQKQTAAEFHAALKAKLDAAGFNEAEQEVGGITAECNAALQLLKMLGPRGMLPFLALSRTMTKALARLSEAYDVSGERCVAVSEIVGEACLKHAEAQLAEMMGGVKLPLGGAAGEQSGGDCHDADCPVHGTGAAMPVGDLDFTRPTKPTDIN